MNPRILIAGIGNIFLGDDAFGVEVAQFLQQRTLAGEIKTVDYGIRSFDLAYALLEPWDAVILVDAVSRGGPPGTLYIIEPDLSGLMTQPPSETEVDAHGMDLVKVLRLASSMGEVPARIYLVGCEPLDFGDALEGRIGLSPPVQAAVSEAAVMIEDLVAAISAAHKACPVH